MGSYIKKMEYPRLASKKEDRLRRPEEPYSSVWATCSRDDLNVNPTNGTVILKVDVP